MALNGINNSSNNYSEPVKAEPVIQKSSSGGSIPESKPISVEPFSAVKSTEGQRQEDVSDKKIKDAVTQANNKMRQGKTRCEFLYHEKSKRVSIKMVDEVTQEVIKEIPPEETIKMIEKMWELAGLLIDEKR